MGNGRTRMFPEGRCPPSCESHPAPTSCRIGGSQTHCVGVGRIFEPPYLLAPTSLLSALSSRRIYTLLPSVRTGWDIPTSGSPRAVGDVGMSCQSFAGPINFRTHSQRRFRSRRESVPHRSRRQGNAPSALTIPTTDSALPLESLRINTMSCCMHLWLRCPCATTS